MNRGSSLNCQRLSFPHRSVVCTPVTLAAVDDMKLRLRNFESKETFRIEVLSPCSVHQLQQALSLALFPPPPSSSSLRFSLNSKDELCAPSPYSSLHSLGVTAGDLIYFSFNPNAFSARLPVQELQTLTPVEESNTVPEPTAIEGSPIPGKPDMSQGIKDSGLNFPNIQSPDRQVYQGSDAQVFTEALESKEAEEIGDEGAEIMDVDGASLRDFSEPYFLSKILRAELGEEDRTNQKLLIISVHAVLLEFGFVAFDPLSSREDRRHLPDKWTSFCQTPSLFYTLPELLHSNIGRDMTDKYIVLKFQTLGNFVSVYGSLAVNGSGLRNVRLDDRFATAIGYVLEKGGYLGMDKAGGLEVQSNASVFDFWKVVKDELALPLMVDLCDKTGLALPACLVRLPTELKMRILELLSGVDLARIELVSKEMKYLVSNNSLWKQKFGEEFGGGTRVEEPVKWKQIFASMWESRKKEKFAVTGWQDYSHVARQRFMRIRRDPNPFEFPGIVGGDHDRLPGLLAPPPFAPAHPTFPWARPRRSFRTNCNLGGGRDI